MWLRKERGGSGAAGYTWANDGDIVEVPDHLALELLEVRGNDYTLVEPEDLPPRRRARAAPTEVAE